MRFVKENWVWILAPIVLFAAFAAYLYFAGDGGSLMSDGEYQTY